MRSNRRCFKLAICITDRTDKIKSAASNCEKWIKLNASVLSFLSQTKKAVKKTDNWSSFINQRNKANSVNILGVYSRKNNADNKINVIGHQRSLTSATVQLTSPQHALTLCPIEHKQIRETIFKAVQSTCFFCWFFRILYHEQSRCF